jgi:hypothetical protein
MVVKQPKFTRVEEPTLLCNQVLLGPGIHFSEKCVNQDLELAMLPGSLVAANRDTE